MPRVLMMLMLMPMMKTLVKTIIMAMLTAPDVSARPGFFRGGSAATLS